MNSDSLLEFPGQFVIEHRSGYRFEREETLARSVALDHERKVQGASLSQMQRWKVPLDDDTVVVGRIPFVKAALRLLGRELPTPQPYPPHLRYLLFRSVERRPLKNVLTHLEQSATPLFLKPAARAKSFTGFVTDDPADFRLNGVSRNQDVWVSEPVIFVTEWRVYVIAGEPFHFSHYKGDAQIAVDAEAVKEALERYQGAGAPTAYVIDFGVLAGGQTTLVEVNDGFSVGAYPGVDPVLYTRMLVARWKELSGSTCLVRNGKY